MHELSIARAVLRMACDVIPTGATVRSLRLRAGAARAIEPEALEFAWQVTCLDSAAEGSTLELVVDPWDLRCRSCGRLFSSDDWQQLCECGGAGELRKADDQLILEEIELAERPHGEARAREPMTNAGGRS